MLLKESKKLKLNVTRLHSYLVSSNKKLKKLRLEETSFLRKLEVDRKRKLKEDKIEAPTKITRIDKIKKSFLGSTMSFFEKVKNFFGLVAFAILVKAIPEIVSGIKKFLDNNPWIIGTIKFIWSTISGAVWVMKGVYDFFTGKGLNGTKLENERNQVDAQISRLPGIQRDLDDSKRSLEGDNNQEEVTTNSSSNFTGGPIPKVVTRDSPTTAKAPTDKDSWYASISEFSSQTGGISRTRRSQYNSQRVDLGGVGHVITGANWMQFMGEKVFDDKFFNLEGEEITRDQFFDKVNELNNQFDTSFLNSSIKGSSLDTSSLSLNSFNIASLNLDGIGSTIQDNYSASYKKGSGDAYAIFNSFRMNEDQQENNLDSFSAIISSLNDSFIGSQDSGTGGGGNAVYRTMFPQGNPVKTSDYGPRTLAHAAGSFHYGLDIGGMDAGTPVHSQEDGIVETIVKDFGGPNNPVGDLLVVAPITNDSSDRSAYGYGHTTNHVVKPGDRVSRGQHLTHLEYYPGGGGQDWTHLHLVKYDKSGKKVDPLPYLRRQLNLRSSAFDMKGHLTAGAMNSETQFGPNDILALPLTRNYQLLSVETQDDKQTEVLVLNRVRAIPFVVTT